MYSTTTPACHDHVTARLSIQEDAVPDTRDAPTGLRHVGEAVARHGEVGRA